MPKAAQFFSEAAMIDLELLFAVTGRVAFFALNGMVIGMLAVYVLGKVRE